MMAMLCGHGRDPWQAQLPSGELTHPCKRAAFRTNDVSPKNDLRKAPAPHAGALGIPRWEHEHLLEAVQQPLTQIHKRCANVERQSNIRSAP
jgi:hypothetical protein